MSFGRNPHVAKAEAAEQKAEIATDDVAYEQAWREAARQWDRAADRETDPKRRATYTQKAEAARATADEPRDTSGAAEAAAVSGDSRLLN
ncbi:MAG TPA: hypothetical protein VHZ95_10240 [Polyangiales bacterium]|nr:hypothetical protein [Polyangiales bacterium]